MPNAKNLGDEADHLTFLLVGGPGEGKTSQFRTLPGKGFVYIFDPNALASLEGMDVDYEQFSPDLLDINVKPLSSKAKQDNVIRGAEPRAYVEWEEHFDQFIEKEMHQYDWIGFDSYTTFGDMVMDRVMWLNGRAGKMPEQDDWAAQMTTIQQVSRVISSRSKLWVATAHLELKKDLLSGIINYQPYLTGRLRIRLPLLFSNIYRCENDRGQYFFHTVNDKSHKYIRSSIKELPPEIDVTIPKDGWNKPGEYGLGRILRDAGKIAPATKSDRKRK